MQACLWIRSTMVLSIRMAPKQYKPYLDKVLTDYFSDK